MFFAVNTQKGGVPSLVDSCDTVSEEEKQLSSIDSTIRYKLKTINETAPTPLTTYLDCFFCSLEQLEEFKIWQEYDMTEDNFCELDGMILKKILLEIMM